jgi:hypothetical protein
MEIASGGGYGTASRLAAHQEDSNGAIDSAKWAYTSWGEVIDTPAGNPNSLAHLDTEETANRNLDEWQIATVRMTFTPSDTTYSVHAWTCVPVFFDGTDSP